MGFYHLDQIAVGIANEGGGNRPVLESFGRRNRLNARVVAGPQPSLESPCVPSLTCTGHGG